MPRCDSSLRLRQTPDDRLEVRRKELTPQVPVWQPRAGKDPSLWHEWRAISDLVGYPETSVSLAVYERLTAAQIRQLVTRGSIRLSSATGSLPHALAWQIHEVVEGENGDEGKSPWKALPPVAGIPAGAILAGDFRLEQVTQRWQSFLKTGGDPERDVTASAPSPTGGFVRFADSEPFGPEVRTDNFTFVFRVAGQAEPWVKADIEIPWPAPPPPPDSRPGR
jgi:hypothetical protein